MDSPTDSENLLSGKWLQQLRLKKKLTVFLVFVGIATFFWFLKALDTNYITQIQYPVVFTGLPANKILINNLPRKLNLEVEGPGFQILRHNWDISKNPLRVNFSQVYGANLSPGNNSNIEIATNLYKSRLSAQLNNVKVNDIKPDTLYFSFSDQSSKKVAVTAELDLDLEKQYMIFGSVETEPDSIEISGPKSLLDTIHTIQTKVLKLHRVSESLNRNVALESNNDQVQLSQRRVMVKIPIEQFTEKKINTPVKVINVPDSVSMRVFPPSITMSFRVGISSYEDINQDDFNISIDYNLLDLNNKKVKPTITYNPDKVGNLKIKPEILDYLLEKR